MIDEIKPLKKINNLCDLRSFHLKNVIEQNPDVSSPDNSDPLMGSIEVIEVIEAWELNYHLGSALKHISRAGCGLSEKADLEKALYYLDGFLRNCLCAKAGGTLKKILFLLRK